MRNRSFYSTFSQLFTMLQRLFLQPIIVCTVSCNIQEPQCTSLYDYEHKLLYKLIQIEEDVNVFRTFIEEFKLENAKWELQHRRLLEASIEEAIFTNNELVVPISFRMFLGLTILPIIMCTVSCNRRNCCARRYTTMNTNYCISSLK